MSERLEEITALVRRAEAAQEAERYAEAAAVWTLVDAAAPNQAYVLHNMGLSRFEAGDYPGAEVALRAAIAISPEVSPYHFHLGTLLQFTGRQDEALGPYEAAHRLWDTAASDINIAHSLLALGRYKEGWARYETRKRTAAEADRLDKPGEWKGEPIGGRSLLIWPEQGFGDQIQFARFAPMLAARGARVTLVAPHQLYPLLCELPVKVLGGEGRVRMPAPDFWTNQMSIPHYLGLDETAISGAPYLRAPQDRRDKWAGFAPPGAIGYAWRSRAENPTAQIKSLPAPDLLLRALAPTGAHLVDLTDPVGDFADMAAVIEQLDLVVTVDTAVAHLAGALGKPCWIMLPWLRCDWRWLRNRDDSPWYDSVRLFRQASAGDWAGVTDAVGRQLAAEGWLG